MNILTISLPYKYVIDHITLTWSDLLFAVDRGYMTTMAVIEHAMYVIGKEQEPSQKVLELAWENSEESILSYLNELSSECSNQGGYSPKDKFLYLLLNWLFEHKAQYPDPLGMVEIIYADFDYPEELDGFVRYMPAQEPLYKSIEANVERLYNNWRSYLEKEKIKFKSTCITDRQQFEQASSMVEKAFHHTRRLPDQVFKMPVRNRSVCEFDRALSDSFWTELTRLADAAGDSCILMAVLDPNPIEYFFKEFDQYNWCILSRGTTAEDYWEMLEQGPNGSPADAILFNSEVVIWLSPSLKWAIWGERSYGICLLGCDDEISGPTSDLWFSIETAITNRLPLNFNNQNVPDDIARSFLKNFRSAT